MRVKGEEALSELLRETMEVFNGLRGKMRETRSLMSAVLRRIIRQYGSSTLGHNKVILGPGEPAKSSGNFLKAKK